MVGIMREYTRLLLAVVAVAHGAGSLSSHGFPVQAVKAEGQAPKKAESSDQGLVTVETSGQGRTPEEAFDDAVRAALLQVAGAFVRSDTRTEADQLVQDRIISHTQGFVERASRMGDAVMSGGRYIQRARVTVRRSRVEEVIREGLKSSSEVDGGTLHARIQTLRQKQATATQLLDALFENWPACVLGWEVSEGPTRVAAPIDGSRLGGDDVAFEAKIDIWVDQDKWKAWCKSAREVFKAVAERTVDLQWSLPSTGYKRIRKEGSDEEKEYVAFITPFISRKAAAAKHWMAQCNHYGRSSDPNCLNRLGELVVSIRSRKVEADNADSLLAGAETLHDGSVVVLLDTIESKATAYLMPNPGLVFGSSKGNGLGSDIFGPPSFVATLQDSAGAALGRTVLPHRNFASFLFLTFPSSIDGAGAAMVEYSTNTQQFQLVCSPAVFSAGGRPQWWRTALLVPALSVWRTRGRGENVLSERLTIPIGFVLSEADVRRISKVEVELGKRVPLFRD